MPDKKTLTDVFTDVADAIREKKSSVEPICPLDFATEISTIEGGGGLSGEATLILKEDGSWNTVADTGYGGFATLYAGTEDNPRKVLLTLGGNTENIGQAEYVARTAFVGRPSSPRCYNAPSTLKGFAPGDSDVKIPVYLPSELRPNPHSQTLPVSLFWESDGYTCVGDTITSDQGYGFGVYGDYEYADFIEMPKFQYWTKDGHTMPARMPKIPEDMVFPEEVSGQTPLVILRDRMGYYAGYAPTTYDPTHTIRNLPNIPTTEGYNYPHNSVWKVGSHLFAIYTHNYNFEYYYDDDYMTVTWNTTDHPEVSDPYISPFAIPTAVNAIEARGYIPAIKTWQLVLPDSYSPSWGLNYVSTVTWAPYDGDAASLLKALNGHQAVPAIMKDCVDLAVSYSGHERESAAELLDIWGPSLMKVQGLKGLYHIAENQFSSWGVQSIWDYDGFLYLPAFSVYDGNWQRIPFAGSVVTLSKAEIDALPKQPDSEFYKEQVAGLAETFILTDFTTFPDLSCAPLAEDFKFIIGAGATMDWDERFSNVRRGWTGMMSQAYVGFHKQDSTDSELYTIEDFRQNAEAWVQFFQLLEDNLAYPGGEVAENLKVKYYDPTSQKATFARPANVARLIIGSSSN